MEFGVVEGSGCDGIDRFTIVVEQIAIRFSFLVQNNRQTERISSNREQRRSHRIGSESKGLPRVFGVVRVLLRWKNGTTTQEKGNGL